MTIDIYVISNCNRPRRTPVSMIRERAYNGLPGLPVLLGLLLLQVGLVWMLVMNIQSESVPEVDTHNSA